MWDSIQSSKQSLTPKHVISMLEPFYAIAPHYFGSVLLSSQLNSKPKRKKGHLAASSILLWLLVTNRPFKPPGRKDVKTALGIGNSRLHDNLHFHNAQWIEWTVRLGQFSWKLFEEGQHEKVYLFLDSKSKTKRRFAKSEIESDSLRRALHAKNFAASYLLETCACEVFHNCDPLHHYLEYNHSQYHWFMFIMILIVLWYLKGFVSCGQCHQLVPFSSPSP